MKLSYTKSDLLQALRRQILVQCDDAAARLLAKASRCVVFKPRQTIIKQGALTDDVFFILSGSVEVIVNGTIVATRAAGQHVGEMAMILKSRRTAKVVSCEESVVAKVTRREFETIAAKRPVFWRNIAVELASRLNQRRNLIRQPNLKPYIFIGSSTKHRCVADALREALSGLDAEIQVWSDPGAFRVSDTFIDTLTEAGKRADFAILVFAKDDVVIRGKQRTFATRDNVVFEAGLFIGAISRARTFIVRPKDVSLRVLSDLAGVTFLDYRMVRKEIDVIAAAQQITAEIRKQWVR